MNIPIVNIHGFDGDGSEQNQQQRINYVLQVGTLSSALEHAVPEQMFVTEENPGEAISAVKALSKASQAGQKIYHITRDNQATILPNINHNSLVMTEIRNALNTGKEVITHTDAVSVPGWSGAGYIIYDPLTGDGAYKIGGGENGGFLLVTIALLIVAIASIVVLHWAIAAYVAAASIGFVETIGVLALVTLQIKASFEATSLFRECGGIGGVTLFIASAILIGILTALEIPILLAAALGIGVDHYFPDASDDHLCSGV